MLQVIHESFIADYKDTAVTGIHIKDSEGQNIYIDTGIWTPISKTLNENFPALNEGLVTSV